MRTFEPSDNMQRGGGEKKKGCLIAVVYDILAGVNTCLQRSKFCNPLIWDDLTRKIAAVSRRRGRGDRCEGDATVSSAKARGSRSEGPKPENFGGEKGRRAKEPKARSADDDTVVAREKWVKNFFWISSKVDVDGLKRDRIGVRKSRLFRGGEWQGAGWRGVGWERDAFLRHFRYFHASSCEELHFNGVISPSVVVSNMSQNNEFEPPFLSSNEVITLKF